MTQDRELAACVERELRELQDLQDLIAHNRSMPSPVITPGCEAYVLEYFRNRRTPAGEDARDAERWRYIAERAPTTIRLDGSMSNPEWAGLCPSYFRGNTADELDAAIDAARREG